MTGHSYISDSGGGRDFKPVPGGLHKARCDMVVSIGEQDTPWGAKAKHVLRFQIPSIRVEYEYEGEQKNLPAIIYQTFTSSLHEKSGLRKALESWRGRKFTGDELKKFDLGAVLGAACQVQVMHNVKGDKTYANINAILPAAADTPALEGETLLYDPIDSPETRDKLPNWLKGKIAPGSNDMKLEAETQGIYQRMDDATKPHPDDPGAVPAAEFEDDEIPF